MNNQSEHAIQNSIRLVLASRGFCVFRANVGKVQMSNGRWFDTGLPKGFSDLFAVKNGKIYFLEVKALHGRASSEQLNFLRQMCDRYGCKGGIVHSVEEALKVVGET